MDERPNPDRLLKQVQAEEQAARSGRLKIFFGASAGVGKTYAMLEAARQRQREGVDVVVGLVETHGRSETAALLEGLELLPRKSIDYHGTRLQEFDLDVALTRRPSLVLVDELAHTNAPGSRHQKRWQDIQELLRHGIDVYSTLNVQHLESMNDVVAKITGVVVRETVPDATFEDADEVEVIDLPPDELLKRLQAGKIYIPELAQRAISHFFRKPNLVALREITLRVAADRLNVQVQTFRNQATPQTWATTERLLVCITSDHSTLHLIRAAHRMARSLRVEWLGVYVETPAELRRPDKLRSSAVQQHLRLAEQLGAETATLSGHSLVEEVVNYARARNVTTIIIAKPTTPWWQERLLGSVVERLMRASGDIHVHVVRADPHHAEVLPEATVGPRSPRSAYVFALRVVALCSLLSWLIAPYLTLANLIMVYLAGVVLVARYAGRGPSIVASFLSVLTFDFLFVPPRFSFTITDTEYTITFLVMLAVSLMISHLTTRLRNQADTSRLRERRTAALYALSRELASNRGTEQLLELAVRHISEVFESPVVAFLPDAKGRLTPKTGWPATFQLNPKEQAVAQWTYDLGQIAGRGTDTLPSSQYLYVPMIAGNPIGALGVQPTDPKRLLIPEQLHLLEAFAHQTALALECDRLEEQTHQATLQIETERLRNAILTSIPHDLRTPLAAILGSASSLLESDGSLDLATRRELLQNICDEAERLRAVLNNVLDLTKLESGTLQVHKDDALPIEEPLSSALARVEKHLADRPVSTQIVPDLPMIPMDATLIEQVLMNLLDNALKYTPAGSPIDIRAFLEDHAVVVEVADRGPGLPGDDPDQLFEKFYRGDQQGREGFGLGLTICRGIIKAHGGEIHAQQRPGGGARFWFTLPVNATTAPA